MLLVFDRISFYKDALETIYQCCSPLHPDYPNIDVARKRAADLATFVQQHRSVDEAAFYTKFVIDDPSNIFSSTNYPKP